MEPSRSIAANFGSILCGGFSHGSGRLCFYVVHGKLAIQIVGGKIFLIRGGPAATRATIFDHRVSPSDLAFVAAQTLHT